MTLQPAKVNEATIHDLKLAIRSIVICYIPNAIPISRIIKLLIFILDEQRATLVSNYGVQKFVEKHLLDEVAIMKGLPEDLLIHEKCRNGYT